MNRAARRRVNCSYERELNFVHELSLTGHYRGGWKSRLPEKKSRRTVPGDSRFQRPVPAIFQGEFYRPLSFIRKERFHLFIDRVHIFNTDFSVCFCGIVMAKGGITICVSIDYNRIFVSRSDMNMQMWAWCLLLKKTVHQATPITDICSKDGF